MVVLPPGVEAPASASLPESLQTMLARSTTGGVLFIDRPDRHMVLPPFATEGEASSSGWDSDPLLSLLLRDRTVGVLLLRRGGYGVAVYEGDKVVLSKVGSRYVHGRNRKGGSSSGRFARRREEQTQSLIDKTCEVVRQRLEPYEKPIHHFMLGGDRLLVQAFRERCTFFKRFTPIVMERHLDLPDPSHKMLIALPALIYTSRVASWNVPLDTMQNSNQQGQASSDE
jgi:hypothetical protein